MIIGGCKTNKSITENGFENDFFGIKMLSCVDIVNDNAIDSKLGTLECRDISFDYDFGPFSYPGPLTPEEEFTRSFDTYHHVKFFEDRLIDPKVYKIFLDSVNQPMHQQPWSLPLRKRTQPQPTCMEVCSLLVVPEMEAAWGKSEGIASPS